jgi:hypothetical protein
MFTTVVRSRERDSSDHTNASQSVGDRPIIESIGKVRRLEKVRFELTGVHHIFNFVHHPKTPFCGDDQRHFVAVQGLRLHGQASLV